MDINNLGQADDAFRVLRVFADADARESLFWKFEDGELKMFANCSDTFDWGSADLEEITPETIPVLEQALKDLQAIDTSVPGFLIDTSIPPFLAELYASRMRKMRPMRSYYRMIRNIYPDAVVNKTFELFNACGPERDS